MHNNQKLITVFHLLVIEDCEDIIESYIEQIVDCGLYESSDKILLRIRYTDFETLSRVITKFKGYQKFDIFDVVHNDSPYSFYIAKYFNVVDPSEFVDGEIPFDYRLGEIETIMDMLCNPNLQKVLSGYDLGFFVHSKSISHLSKINTKLIDNVIDEEYESRISYTTRDSVKSAMKSFFKGFRKCLNHTLRDNLYGYSDMFCKNRAFSFKIDWVVNFNMEEYFKAYKLYENYEMVEDDPEEVVDIIKYNNEAVLGDKIAMTNRHVFFNFPLIVNHMVTTGKIEKLK